MTTANSAIKYYPTLREAYVTDFEDHDFIAEILEYEDPTQPVYVDADGVLRFVEDPATVLLMDDLNMLDLNQLYLNWHHKLGAGKVTYKNDPRYRTLMQRIGYSVYGYWEITRWEANNPNYELYVDPNRELDV